jgi:hypothetical protein
MKFEYDNDLKEDILVLTTGEAENRNYKYMVLPLKENDILKVSKFTGFSVEKVREFINESQRTN